VGPPLSRRAGRECVDADSRVVARHEDASVACHVVQREAAGDAQDRALVARQRDRVQPASVSRTRRGEPDLVARGRPGEPLNTHPTVRERAAVRSIYRDRQTGVTVLGLEFLDRTWEPFA
jgi:hypothetical protein